MQSILQTELGIYQSRDIEFSEATWDFRFRCLLVVLELQEPGVARSNACLLKAPGSSDLGLERIAKPITLNGSRFSSKSLHLNLGANSLSFAARSSRCRWMRLARGPKSLASKRKFGLLQRYGAKSFYSNDPAIGCRPGSWVSTKSTLSF